MYSKKTLTLLAVIAGAALIVAYWKEIQAFVSSKTQGLKANLSGSATDTSSTPKSSTGSSSTSTPAPATATQGTLSFSELLKRGSKGKSVTLLQMLLNAGWKKGLVEDGNFGPATEGALYQVTGKYSITLSSFTTGYVNTNASAYAVLQAAQKRNP